jgi:Alcohol dehydrogenase, class IV
MNSFACFLPGNVEYGAGKIALLPEWVRGKKILLLSDAGVKKSGCLDALAAECGKKASHVIEFYDTPTEPSEDQAAEIANRFRSDALDAIVAVGGGSVLDMAKILAVLIGSNATVQDLFDGKLPESRNIKLYMAPTTSGTGAEATPNSILYRPSMKLKVGIVCSLFVADRIVLDPELTLGLPPAVTASTGLDALCHAVECLVSKKANPLSDVLAVESVRLIFSNLRACHKDGKNLEARGNMLLASFYAGICIACSGTNIVHALSYPLGGRYRIAHGVSNAALLAAAMAFNRDVAADKLERLACFAPGYRAGLGGKESVDLVLGELAALTRDLGIPGKLGDFNIPAGDLDILVEDAFKVRRLLDNNPREVGKDDIRAIYSSLL